MCTRIVANAPHLALDLVQRGHVSPQKAVYIPNGIAVEQFAQPHDPTLRERIKPTAGRVFVSLGRISLERDCTGLRRPLGCSNSVASFLLTHASSSLGLPIIRRRRSCSNGPFHSMIWRGR